MLALNVSDGTRAGFMLGKKEWIMPLNFTSKLDGIIPMEQPKRLYDAIKSDNKRIVISEKSAHCSMNTTGYTFWG